jgi:KaiC/GvpD/RAD55 family RecA-like ATPase
MSSMDDTHLGDRISYIPFGVSELDGHHRGIPTGSAVLLAGASDAGVSAFTYTSLGRLMLAQYDPKHVPDRLADRAEHIPESVTYVTLTHDREHVYSELEAVLPGYAFETLCEHLTIVDYSQRYLDLLPVPPSFFEQRRDAESEAVLSPDLAAGDGTDEESFRQFLDDVSETLADASEDLLVLDSFSDLRRATAFGLERGHGTAFLMGLREAIVNWGSVAYIKYERRAEEVRSDTSVHGLLHGSLYFYSNDQGFETYRTMRVGSFGGALDSERQVTFESAIGDGGFQAKAKKKISPNRW